MQRFNPATLEEWRQSPLTQVFLRYLKDRQDRLASQWASGAALSAESQTQARLMGELSALDWCDYAEFYGLDD